MMAKSFVIDGYNLLLYRRGRSIRPGPGNLERAREALVGWIERRMDQLGEATIVFDARSPASAGLKSSRAGRVRVVYAVDHESADQWIIDWCDDHRGTEGVIVTNDRAIQLAARQDKLEILSCAEFIEWLDTPAPMPRSHQPAVPQEKDEKPEGELLTDADRAAWRTAFVADDSEPTPTKSIPPSPNASASPPPVNKLDALRDFEQKMRQWEKDQGQDRSKKN